MGCVKKCSQALCLSCREKKRWHTTLHPLFFKSDVLESLLESCHKRPYILNAVSQLIFYHLEERALTDVEFCIPYEGELSTSLRLNQAIACQLEKLGGPPTLSQEQALQKQFFYQTQLLVFSTKLEDAQELHSLAYQLKEMGARSVKCALVMV